MEWFLNIERYPGRSVSNARDLLRLDGAFGRLVRPMANAQEGIWGARGYRPT